jgi:hypothetical protein
MTQQATDRWTPEQIARIKAKGKARFEELEAQPAAAESRAQHCQEAGACMAAVQATREPPWAPWRAVLFVLSVYAIVFLAWWLTWLYWGAG